MARDTRYATLLKEARCAFKPGEDCRIERLFVKEEGQEEIRFSWWKENRIARRPLDLSEPELLELMRRAIQQQVFSPEFLQQLKQIIP